MRPSSTLSRPLAVALCLAAAALIAACDALEPRGLPDDGASDSLIDSTLPDEVDGLDVDPPDGADGDVEHDLDMPARWVVVVSPDAPEAVVWSAQDLVHYLGAMGLEAALERSEDAALRDCVTGAGRVVMLGEGLEVPRWNTPRAELTEQSWRIDELRCEGGARIELAGRGLLGRQFAAYAWLHALGVRFFHPEDEFVPDSPMWPDEPLVVEKTPPFRANSVSLHLTHPLELGDAYRLGKEEYYPEVKRYIDWGIKNFASLGSLGVGSGELADYGRRRGFPRTAGFSLHNQQQGANAIIDPDDPRSEEEQIAAAIDARMGNDPNDYPEYFDFTFNPSEFTEIPDTDAVRQLTFIADYLAENYPRTIVLTTNHPTAGEPTATYGVRYYDLPQFAPSNLGVKMHTVMFYDLFRPAPVYGNTDFHFIYDFMVQEYRKRRLWYFPEAAWWLTFDLAVPLYLPITVEARDRDLQNLAFMLEGGLDGHRVFGTGHEWGYWQNEYCSLRMAADLDYRWKDCFADVALPTGEAADVLVDVLEDLVVLQERDFIYDAELLAYLVGTDPETEIAASVGIVFHPLPPSPQAIMRWSLAEVDRFRARIEPALRRMDRDYAALVARLRAVEHLVPQRGRPWFDEILDGIEVSGLRARHAWQVYGAVVTLREARLRFDDKLVARSHALLADARATTQDAIGVIRRREAGYRYQPIERSIGGGTQGNEDENWTVYKYRYLNRTHTGYFYTRIDDLAAEVLAGSGDAVEIADTLLALGESLELRVVDTGIDTLHADFGDGQSQEGVHIQHTYAQPGLYAAELTASRDGAPLRIDLPVASLPGEERATGFSGTVVEPEGAALIEPVLPALVVGRLDEERLVLGYDVTGQGHVGLERWVVLDAVDTTSLESAPADLVVPIVNRSDGRAIASIAVVEGVLEQPEPTRLMVRGQLVTDDVIDALVAIGGFDERGAREIVAATLGYTAQTLPDHVAFAAEWTLSD